MIKNYFKHRQNSKFWIMIEISSLEQVIKTAKQIKTQDKWMKWPEGHS